LIVFAEPQLLLFGNPSTPFLLIIIKFIALLVGMYGIAYYFASRDPQRYWHLILVGFIGKGLTAVFFLYYSKAGLLHPKFITLNIWNNIIWVVPMAWVLYTCRAKKHYQPVTEWPEEMVDTANAKP
jgi:uncharacterized membrane protein HdeD (DUF308 family)